MAKVKVKMRSSGAIELMNSSAMQSHCLGIAESVAASASTYGSGTFHADVRAGKSRCHAMVRPQDAKAVYSNRKHNSMLKALHSYGG